MRVLVVDDSVVFRSQIKAALEDIEGISIVGAAANGKIALAKLEETAVDVIILDLEMPEMSGLEMLAAMKTRGFKQTVIVFAAPSGTGVELAMLALRAGASDFISKPLSSGSLEAALEGIKRELVPKILQFKDKVQRISESSISKSGTSLQAKIATSDVVAVVHPYNRVLLHNFKPRVVGIGSSTGGPTALDAVFATLKGRKIKIPIFIAQHMPPNFTEHLAKRLSDISGHPVREGKHGEIVSPGVIYVAPGDFHMTVARSLDKTQILVRIDQGPKRNSVRPAVDNLFESLSQVYGDACAAFIFTGMGEDGMVGAQAIKAGNGGIMIQDQASSVVWGMPGAVHACGAFDSMGDLDQCADVLLQMVG